MVLSIHSMTFNRVIVAASILMLLAASFSASAVQSDQNLLTRLHALEMIKSRDNPKFVAGLKAIRPEVIHASPKIMDYWSFLSAWQQLYLGHAKQASTDLLRLSKQGNPTMQVRSLSLLSMVYLSTQQYEKAYKVTEHAIDRLPHVTEPEARFQVLSYAAQLMALGHQFEQGLIYARQAQRETPPGQSRCMPYSFEVAALIGAKHLKWDSPTILRAVRLCQMADMPLVVNTMRLDQASLALEQKQPQRALWILQSVIPSIEKRGYMGHRLSSRGTLAATYLALGDDKQAEKTANEIIRMSPKDEKSWSLMRAYEVLYTLSEKTGNYREALAYYKAYIGNKSHYLNDVAAMSLAYQKVKQQVMASHMRIASLDRRNKVLSLQQSLAEKKTEATRLYMIFLATLLIFITMWLYRVYRLQRRFRHLAQHDGLTGMMNHQHFISECERALSRLKRADIHASLVLMDLDYFKQINDRHGHAIGDQVLRQVTQLCQQMLRSEDMFGRLGGEEFGIFLPGCTCERGVEITNRIRMTLAETPVPAQDENLQVSISASFGLACSDRSGYDMSQLCSDADNALYRAKRGGRNRLMVADAQAAATDKGADAKPVAG